MKLKKSFVVSYEAMASGYEIFHESRTTGRPQQGRDLILLSDLLGPRVIL